VVSTDARPGVRSNSGPVALAYEPKLKVRRRLKARRMRQPDSSLQTAAFSSPSSLRTLRHPDHKAGSLSSAAGTTCP
jgi:hypothetical protein